MEEYKPKDTYQKSENPLEEGGGYYPVLSPEQTEALRKAIAEAQTS